MKYLISQSTGKLSYTPNEDADTMALVLTNESGTTITLAGTPADTDGVWSIDVQSTELPASLDYQRLTAAWTWTSGTATRRDREFVEVRPHECPALVYHKDARDALGLSLGADDEVVASTVDAASEAVLKLIDASVPRVTEARLVRADGATLYPRELRSLTSVADEDGDAITTSTINIGGFVRYIRLGAYYDEFLTVTGEWGYDDLPDDIAQAVLLTVRTWYSLDRGAFAVNLDGSTGFIEWRPALPTRASALIEAYRRAEM